MKLLKIIVPLFLIAIVITFTITKCRKDESQAVLPKDKLSVCYIDVGQGDSAFLSSGGKTMLIDCGESDETENVIDFLNEKGVKSLDYVIASHPHSDHMGGMYKIIDEFDIGEVIIPHLHDSDIPTTRYFEKFLDSCDAKNLSLTEAEPGNIFALGEAEVEIIAPCSDKYDNINNYSVGLFITHGENTFIFTGDAESKAEKEMLESGKLRHADVYKAGHHGSSSSSSAKFMKEISPDHVVISCGAGNSYGHPNQKALDEMGKYTKNIYRTDLEGTIIFTSDGEKLTVSTEKD